LGTCPGGCAHRHRADDALAGLRRRGLRDDGRLVALEQMREVDRSRRPDDGDAGAEQRGIQRVQPQCVLLQ
jgi:hypothetical protein